MYHTSEYHYEKNSHMIDSIKNTSSSTSIPILITIISYSDSIIHFIPSWPLLASQTLKINLKIFTTLSQSSTWFFLNFLLIFSTLGYKTSPGWKMNQLTKKCIIADQPMNTPSVTEEFVFVNEQVFFDLAADREESPWLGLPAHISRSSKIRGAWILLWI